MATKTKSFRLGCEGFGYDNWRGNFYPPKLSDRRYLEFYSKVFDSVEINSTFYELPKESTVRNWTKVVGDDFVFTAKFPQSITHAGRLTDSISLASAFATTMSKLGSKLGALLLQFSPNFDKTRKKELFELLDGLPSRIRYAVELRNASWFQGEFVEDFLKSLSERRIALCCTDHPTVPRAIFVTTDFVYVRWQASGRQIRMANEISGRMKEIGHWAKDLQKLHDSVNRIYCFMNDDFVGHAPAGVTYLRRCFGLEAIMPQSVWPDFGEFPTA